MPTEDEWGDFVHLVSRHEDAINEGAADIRKIKEQIGLIAEALQKIEIAAYRGSQHDSHVTALRRLKEIVKILTADYPASR